MDTYIFCIFLNILPKNIKTTACFICLHLCRGSIEISNKKSAVARTSNKAFDNAPWFAPRYCATLFILQGSKTIQCLRYTLYKEPNNPYSQQTTDCNLGSSSSLSGSSTWGVYSQSDLVSEIQQRILLSIGNMSRFLFCVIGNMLMAPYWITLQLIATSV